MPGGYGIRSDDDALGIACAGDSESVTILANLVARGNAVSGSRQGAIHQFGGTVITTIPLSLQATISMAMAMAAAVSRMTAICDAAVGFTGSLDASQAQSAPMPRQMARRFERCSNHFMN